MHFKNIESIYQKHTILDLKTNFSKLKYSTETNLFQIFLNYFFKS